MKTGVSNKYGIVLLAAGKSSRLGTPKQLLAVEGFSLIKRAATTALEISNKIVVVTGSENKRIEEELHELGLHIKQNILFDEGIASSIRIGLTAIVKAYGQLAGAIFIVCDQPYLSPAILQKLIEVAGKTNKVFGNTPLFYENRHG